MVVPFIPQQPLVQPNLVNGQGTLVNIPQPSVEFNGRILEIVGGDRYTGTGNVSGDGPLGLSNAGLVRHARDPAERSY